jgi:AMP deaminase
MQQLYRQQQQQRQLRGGQQQQRQQQRQQASPSVPPSLATGAAAGVAPSAPLLLGGGVGAGTSGILLPPPSNVVTSADDMAKEGALIEAAVGGGGGGGKEKSSAASAAAAGNDTAASSGPSSASVDPDDNAVNAAASQAAYCRVITPEPAPSEEAEDVCALLRECLELRAKWLFTPATLPERRPPAPEAAAPSEVQGAPPPFEWGPNEPGPAPFVAEMVGGVMHVYEKVEEDEEEAGGGEGGGAGNEDEGGAVAAAASSSSPPRTADETPRPQPRNRGRRVFAPPGDANAFFADLHRVLKIAALGPVKSFAHHRLVLLEQKFNLHVMLNADKEFLAQKSAPHRDFYNVRKVDTHVHHSACMHQKHLLRFMKSKLRKEPDEVVIFRDGK